MTLTIGTKYLDAHDIISAAQKNGLTIDSSNIVDLLADNMDRPLSELREIAVTLAKYNHDIPCPRDKGT